MKYNDTITTESIISEDKQKYPATLHVSKNYLKILLNFFRKATEYNKLLLMKDLFWFAETYDSDSFFMWTLEQRPIR